MAYGFETQRFFSFLLNSCMSGSFQSLPLITRSIVNFRFLLTMLSILHFFSLPFLTMPAIVEPLSEQYQHKGIKIGVNKKERHKYVVFE